MNVTSCDTHVQIHKTCLCCTVVAQPQLDARAKYKRACKGAAIHGTALSKTDLHVIWLISRS